MKNNDFYSSVYITRKQKIQIEIKNISNKLVEEIAQTYPYDENHDYDECFNLFHLRLNIFIEQNSSYKKLNNSKELFRIYCSSSSSELEIECYKDFGIIVIYYHYYHSERYFTKIEIARFLFVEYTQAIIFIEEFNNKIHTVIPELLSRLEAIQEKKINPKSFDISVSSIRAICSTKQDSLWVYPFFSEIEGYILFSIDGVDMYLIELLLSASSNKMSDLLQLCNSPKNYVSEDKTMSCIKLHKITKKELFQIFEEHTDIDEKQLDFWFE